MSGPDLLERTRMALAEAGHRTDIVRPTERPDMIEFLVDAIPAGEVWKAISIARGRSADQRCWACCLATPLVPSTAEVEASRAACLADRPLVRDCGITR